MKFKTWPFLPLLASMFVIVLNGCVTEKQIIQKSDYVFIPVGAALTTPIIPPSPPEHDAYVNASFEDRAQMLSDYIADLLKTTSDLNYRLGQIADQDAKNGVLIKQKNQEETDRVNKLTDAAVKTAKGN